MNSTELMAKNLDDKSVNKANQVRTQKHYSGLARDIEEQICIKYFCKIINIKEFNTKQQKLEYKGMSVIFKRIVTTEQLALVFFTLAVQTKTLTSSIQKCLFNKVLINCTALVSCAHQYASSPSILSP